MQPGGLVERLRRIPGLEPVVDPRSFDPTNDLHLEQAARLLLDRFRAANDTDAFTLLFELTHERLRQIASQLTRRLSATVDPDDLASTFMARLFAEVSDRDPTPVRRFLALAHASMRNSVFDQMRQQRRARAGSERYLGTLGVPRDPALQAEHHEEDGLLQRCGERLLSLTDECFHQLDARDKNVLVAREILGMSYDRVAGLLELESGQVGMIIRRARQHLADLLVARLPELPLADDSLQPATDLVRRYLQCKERSKNVGSLVQRMLEAAADAGRRRLADLVYEMAKSCLLAVPDFEQRMLVRQAPRGRQQVADDVRHMSARLAAVAEQPPVTRVADVARHLTTREAALDDTLTCLHSLEQLEGPSGRSQVALALHHIHTGRLTEAERLLRALAEADIPAVTRQNVFRNLTLTLLRQERWDDALEIAEISGVDWPDDPVRHMNICYATARLGNAEGFESHVRRLVALNVASPQPRVQAWIDRELQPLAQAVGLQGERLNTLVLSAREDAADGNAL